ncbi:GNAT family N-acetyltransferase [Pelagibius sp. CAU 1746]|uniref:GNAT family N-acetyltransferase n=1 Tax=Pelagibius sp. CAU 1746 TaxID=3140370 RepID=UPI00325B0BEF
MLVFRKLMRQESSALKEHLLRLDEEDRRLRFGHFVTAEVILAYVDAIDWSETWIVGAFEGEVLRGVVELRDSGAVNDQGAGRKTAEISVTVEPDHQNHGVGTRLLEEALLIASNRGFQDIYLICLPENARMQHVARKYAERVRFEDGDVEIHIAGRQPDPLSYFAEIFGDGIALWETAFDRMTSRPTRKTAS